MLQKFFKIRTSFLLLLINKIYLIYSFSDYILNFNLIRALQAICDYNKSEMSYTARLDKLIIDNDNSNDINSWRCAWIKVSKAHFSQILFNFINKDFEVLSYLKCNLNFVSNFGCKFRYFKKSGVASVWYLVIFL